jgi:CubicO group peptidase (beta-lactamase class C family)
MTREQTKVTDKKVNQQTTSPSEKSTARSSSRRDSAKAQITAAQARAHVIKPSHLKRVCDDSDEHQSNEQSLEQVRTQKGVRRSSRAPSVDLSKLGAQLWEALHAKTAGYLFQVRHSGVLIFSGVWNWARTPADKAKGWTQDTRMHVASVSKFLTAVGLVKLLDDKGISYDARITDCLPDYWQKGPNVNKITFRHLLTHKSGFRTAGGASDFATMKTKVAAGVKSGEFGTYKYQNMNFGLCRILMTIISGKLKRDVMFQPPSMNDKFWDVLTIDAYRSYMQAKVFTPAGVHGVGFAPTSGANNAFAYPAPPGNQKGWDSKDLSTASGGAGWRLSMKELLDVMHHVRRTGSIVSPAKAQYLLDHYFGIDSVKTTPGGKTYCKNGRWQNAGDEDPKVKAEECVAYFLPNDMEMVVFANSRVLRATGKDLRGLVDGAFANSF